MQRGIDTPRASLSAGLLHKLKQAAARIPWWTPLILIAVLDIALRWDKALFWKPREWAGYGVSILYVWAALILLRRGADILQRRRPLAVPVLVAGLALLSMFLHISHIAHFLYFGSHPTVVNIGYLLAEPVDGWGNAMEAAGPLAYTAAVLLVGVFWGSWHVALRNGHPARRTVLASAGVLVLLLTWPLHWNVGLLPGSVLPSVNMMFSASRAVANQVQGEGIVRRLQLGHREQIPPQDRPLPFNVVMIVHESLRADGRGHPKQKRGNTPEQLAFRKRHRRNVVRFPQFYANSTTTSESVPSLMTGVHPAEDFRTLHDRPLIYEYAGAFRNVRSVLFSAHRYNLANFRLFFQSPALDRLYYAENSGHPPFNGLGIDDGLVVTDFLDELHRTPASERFFGVLHLRGTHYPYDVPEPFQRYDGPGLKRWSYYDNTVLYSDHNVGRVLKDLEASGRLKNTLVIVTADHGEAMGEHRQLHGHRSGFYDEMVHVPFWVYLPPDLAKRVGKTLRRNSRLPASNLDLVPTMIDLLGLEADPAVAGIQSQLEGDSLVRPLPRGRSILAQNSPFNHPEYLGFVLIQDQWRLLHHKIAGRFYTELFDVDKDPRQRRNLWKEPKGERLALVRHMAGRWPAALKLIGVSPSASAISSNP